MFVHSLLCFFLVMNIANGQYFGRSVGNFTTNAHSVRGAVYIIDRKRLYLVNFNYDGNGPDAFFYGGMRGESSQQPSGNGTRIPDDSGQLLVKLGPYTNQTIVLTLPDKYETSQLTWLAVWCRQFAVDFGHVTFADNLTIPSEKNIGRLSTLAHQVSGTVTVLNSRQFKIENFIYDGNGPDAFFVVGPGSNPGYLYTKVPDENGITSKKLGAYSGVTITITLAAPLTVFDIGYLSVYCISYTHDFGNVMIPSDLVVPPFVDMPSPENCESLNDMLNVAWEVTNTTITFELMVAFNREDRYVAFGLSGSSTSSIMKDADVFVASYRSGSGPVVVDYFLSEYSACSSGIGACPDTSRSGGIDDITGVSGNQVSGISRIRFSRNLVTGDIIADRQYDTGKMLFIVWATGLLSPSGLVTKHDARLAGSKSIQFGRPAADNCQRLSPGNSGTPPKAWTIPALYATASKTRMEVKIGQAGGSKGYTAITGINSWGIALYINNTLIPEIYVQRGVNYTFIVETGDNPSNQAQFHPLYITNDAVGGYAQKTAEQRAAIRVFAGVDSSGNYTAAGRYCEFQSKPGHQAENYDTFEAYFTDALTLNCVAGETVVLEWTPDENTPDLVYYQCYTHNYLGWKIHVQDKVVEPNAAVRMSGIVATASLLLLAVLL